MNLPEELERSFNTEIANYEEDQKMPYITPLERFAQEQGREQGLEEGALRRSREAVFEILTARFSSVPGSLTESVNQLNDLQPLKALLVQAATLPSLEAFEEALQQWLSDSDSD
ncbi:hypothetical protein [Sodalinema gerasimenkoae]|uniref:hypothetical protein n=1 Tax=Sodalinema gerasimenkoae TaxID=2862348 RepID=UPI001359A117|nr:hypothetical protein [Sodalinema gerasimenkoae]